MGDDGNCWDPYCPCRVTRKNIVMTILVILSVALVAWTVVTTGLNGNAGKTSNITHVVIDDSKGIDKINITMSTVRAVSSAKASAERKTAALAKAKGANKALENQKVKLKFIVDPMDSESTLCKCLCNLNVTLEQVQEALQFMETYKPPVKVTTTPAPVLEDGGRNDPMDWDM